MNWSTAHLPNLRHSRLHFVLPPTALVVAIAALFYFWDGSVSDDSLRDDDLCPIDREAISRRAVLLFDFNKPIDPEQSTLPGDLLRDMTRTLERNTELQVFSLTGSDHAPGVRLERLCKPYDNAELQVGEAKDQNGAARDCDDLPAQLAEDVRRSIGRFCRGRELLQQRLNALARRTRQAQETVADTYLIEALEDIWLEIEERPGPHSLHVFSDMMQHTHWYSHLDIKWSDWDYKAFAERLDKREGSVRQRWNTDDLKVDLFYIPRRGSTDQPRVKQLHQRFWREYFAGAPVDFHGQPPMAAYTAETLMDIVTDSDVVTRERALIERLSVRVKREQEDLERAKQELETERRRLSATMRQEELKLQPLLDEANKKSQRDIWAEQGVREGESQAVGDVRPREVQLSSQEI